MLNNAYCVNLAHRTDRWEHFLEEQKFLGIDVTRFEAVDGKTCGRKPGKPPVVGWSTISLGNLGNVLSQRQIIKRSQEDGKDSVCIFEDDVEFDKMRDIPDFLCRIPNDWDMIYFGGNHMEPLLPISDTVGKCIFTLACHAVIIKNTMYNKILDITENLAAPIDLYYAMLHPHYNVYAPIKPIAWQMDGYSDIEDKNVSYEHLR